MKLIAIDGNSLMHRAYYALPNMTNKAGYADGRTARLPFDAAEAC